MSNITSPIKKYTTCITLIILLSFFFVVSSADTCNKKHTVGVGESCKSIAENAHVSATDFMKWNPSLKKDDCESLHVGQIVCLGESPTLETPPAKPQSHNKTTHTTSTKKHKKKTESTVPATYLPGLTITVTDERQFCLLLPPSPGNRDNHNGTTDPDAISNTEKSAIVFCTEQDLAPGAQLMPEGFIATAEYQFNTTAEFVQVRGKIDREKYDLSRKDGGGQYDNHGEGSPPASMCQGYNYYVSLIEPDIQGFCVRCCQSYADCNSSRSAYGCKRVVPPLDYSI